MRLYMAIRDNSDGTVTPVYSFEYYRLFNRVVEDEDDWDEWWMNDNRIWEMEVPEGSTQASLGLTNEEFM